MRELVKEFDKVLFEREGSVAYLTLNDPANKNPVTVEIMADLNECLNVCERDGMLFAPALFSDLPCLVNGVMLGHTEKDGRFTPSHQLFTALGDRCRSVLSLAPDDPRVAEYLAGREIAGDVRGRCAVAVNGHALGGGKGSGGVVKNNYPKNLRTH